ncbi:two-component sensor histidine kinase [Leifsonia sp. ZF2019]|uniref:sensor histidine kinase n=1 Tax=Leifsonia sp. ZF2019 TaxID=2781978 RepID=UPI001CBE7B38|nr:histidine kinase [Leifsonia sp. ZF2019]UAJ77736.1 two-component sensor histidine kinase [Leifsonia sp. ZF2019]
MLDRTRLLSALAPHRWVLEPAVAVVLFVAWLFSGLPTALSALALLFYCAAVALSRVLPGVALGIVWTAVLLELTEPDPLPGAFRIIGAVAIFATVFGIAAHGGRVLRWFAFASACLIGPAMAYLFTVKGELKFLQFGPVIGGYYASQGVGLLLMSLLMIVAFLIGWLLGYLVARQRAFASAAGGPSAGGGQRGSVLVWLASSGGAVVAEGDPDRPRLVQRLSRGQLTFDMAGAAAFVVFCLFVDSADLFGATRDGSRSGTIVLAVFTVAVALRRMSPAVALAFAWLAAVIQMTTGNSILASDLGVLLVLYATAAYGDRVVRWVGLVSAGLGALVAALYLSVTSALSQGYFDLLSTSLTSIALQFAFLFVVSATMLGLSWVLGLLMRTWREARFSRYAQTVAELDRNRAEEVVVVEQERTRIARDMHDVVAHSLAVVIAQADGARYARHTDPGAVDEALTTIAATARSALGDVRVLLAELRQSQPEGPQPSLDDVPQTIEHIRAAGLPVAFERLGRVDGLGSAQQIAGFRIVQEALTNALRHGDTSQPATVVLAAVAADAGGPGIVITVRNTMKHLPADELSTGTVPRIGHGLPGMRERASLAGGTLSAGPVDGVFVVSAFLPAGGAA